MKLIKHIPFLLIALLLIACSSDDDQASSEENSSLNPLEDHYEIETFKVLQLGEEVTSSDKTYTWHFENQEVSTQPTYAFISSETGSFEVAVAVSDGQNTEEFTTTIEVVQPQAPYSKNISEVIDYQPAPGQFINKLPNYDDGDTKEEMVSKAFLALTEGGGISLGAFGGSVTFKFDHTIMNTDGANFKVLGNAFMTNAAENRGNSEPGIIMVAWDKNGNGIPDEDEWYEIVGSAHDQSTTIQDYKVTYFQPDPDKEPVPGEGLVVDKEYIKWKDNQGEEGYLPKIGMHQQNYFPNWLSQDSLTFKGTRIAGTFEDVNGDGSYYEGTILDYGYADNAPNDDERTEVDIDWAVDQTGEPVELPGIDFIKIYTGVLQEIGALGEVSTEVMGAEDLNIE